MLTEFVLMANTLDPQVVLDAITTLQTDIQTLTDKITALSSQTPPVTQNAPRALSPGNRDQ